MDSHDLDKRQKQTGSAVTIRNRKRVGSFFLLFLLPLTGWAQSPTLSTSSELATAGYYQLSWKGTKAPAFFQLQESQNPDFSNARLIYEGPNTASVISGRSDGQYLYRIRQIEGPSSSPWSQSVEVTVTHHALDKALGFFFIGLIVFIGTLGAIIYGNKQFTR